MPIRVHRWIPLAGILFILFPLGAHDIITTKITWTREMSRIVYKRCASCHRDGGAAFSLMSYEEARPWAKAIRDQVLGYTMPPWGAVKGVGQFRDDPSLTPLETDMIVSWVEGGAPEGETAYMPKRPVFAAAARVTPDIAGEKFEVASETTVSKPLRLAGIRPRDLGDGKSMEVTAWLPDGGVTHLIWLRNYKADWTRTYLFREPVSLPKGCVIRVYTDAPAKAILYIAG